jgi:RND family efflux transporter MFP subunit
MVPDSKESPPMPDPRGSFTNLAILLLAAASSASFAQDQRIPVVQTASVLRIELAPTVSVPGTVFSRSDVQVTAGVDGQIEMVAEPGTVVMAGQAVARIDRTALLLQREGQEALLERAEINLRQLDSQLRRQRELHSSSVVSEFDLEQTEANRDLAKSDASITRVRIRQIDDEIRRAEVVARFTGVVTERLRREGEDVARGEVLARLTDIENMEVRAFVPLRHLPRTAVGGSIRILADQGDHEGIIRAVVPTGDVRSQTFETIIDLPPDARNIWTVGQLVSVAVPISTTAPALAVPRDALILRQNGSFVFRINNENRAERIYVDIGDSAGDLVAVAGSLQEGDRIAVRGAENLADGAEVRAATAQSAAAAQASDGG